MKDILKNKLILASGSPRRKELMSLLKTDFDVIVADIDETINLTSPLEEEIKSLAKRKAMAVFKDHNDAYVIGSDTIVTIDDKVLGKPKTFKEAYDMLALLSGRKHQVITGVSILGPGVEETFASISNVYFNKLSKEEIENYITTNSPYDKAGSYAIQGDAALFVNRIEGDYYSIIGFPINQVYQILKKLKAI